MTDTNAELASVLTGHLPMEQWPPIPAAKGAYTTVTRHGNLVFVAGMLPLQPDGSCITGTVGSTLTLEQGQQAALASAATAIRAVEAALGEGIRAAHWMRIDGYVRSAPDFDQQHVVLNPASELIAACFGDRGVSTRTAIGVHQLPLGAATQLAAALLVNA